MKYDLTIKEQLFAYCEQHIADRIATIEQNLQSIKEARNNETKSTAGDKHETGRAMMQIEERNSQAQLSEAMRVKNELTKIDPFKKSNKAALGSLVQTNNGLYYISIGLGKVTMDEKLYFCVSVNSPIGKELMHKEAGDTFTFNGNSINIEAIS
jgi:transcription elongation GreA/GreB family factor